MKLLDRVKAEYPDSSNAQIKKWICHGRVLVGGKVCNKPHATTSPKALVKLQNKQPIRRKLKGIDLLFEDSDVIVIFKPAGLLSVALDKKEAPNVHALLKEYCKPTRVYPVHRLDRDTSGILVFALNESARDNLKEQFFKHTIVREYCALVEGQVSPQKGTWISRLIEDKSCKMHITQSKQGKMAITHYRVAESNESYSKLIVELKTGRKNQIRAQAQSMGHSIVGDVKYGAVTDPIGRVGLHATRLEFDHPNSDLGRKKFHIPPDEVFDSITSL